ncbi:diheme cytochrome c-553 [Mariniflexile litorale]|uniref:Diheme cytochrome c-553 n=1 Tax=Mariniflexile litorale TaxID=3045158 RepID=A0AAU7EIH2_9FLAO|nr:diheme cytochrome c-553 [Mariniflexile sp. KMM 9835]MDQ8210153.1 diheme cytochrome c-553 [Mariniflexile sp. KMM 9835]
MKTNSLFIIATLCVVVYSCNSNKKDKATFEYEPSSPVTLDPIKRGENLVNAIGCHDCHTPKKFTEQGITLDIDRLLSGHPANEKLPEYDQKTAQSYVLLNMGLTSATGPWGTSFAANLTPAASGIGSWSESQFLKSIKEGKYKGLDTGRTLLPPMPWQSYSNLPDDDLKSIFAYLKSINPVENIVPASLPPMAMN